MNDLIIREATQQDIPQLGKLNHQLIQDEGHENKLGVTGLQKRMAVWLLHEYRCFVATQKHLIVGYALFKSTATGFYLRQLFVSRDHRRLGIGTALLDFLFAEVWHEQELRLEVLSTNHQAIAFYEQYGLSLYCHTFRRAAKA
ncbi:MAG: GNAT family N-acetyltransferase [Chloroflexota bacterium]